MILQRTLDTYCGLYDFAVTGGAVGSYDLQIPIPVRSICVEFFALASASLAGVGATISFDKIDISVSPHVTGVGDLTPARPITDYQTPGGYIFGVFGALATFDAEFSTLNMLTPVGLYNTQSQNTDAYSIGMSIGANPITAGRIFVCARCISLDITI